jgi:hypothetical protein
VIARRDARVRNQQHGRAVCGQRPLREKKTFFGDFLPFSKKVTRSLERKPLLFKRLKTSSATLTPTLSRQRERGKINSWIPAFAGMTSD